MTQLRVVLIKPSKYSSDGSVERFKKGFLPNATLFHIASLTPARIRDVPVTVHQVDEYVPIDDLARGAAAYESLAWELLA